MTATAPQSDTPALPISVADVELAAKAAPATAGGTTVTQSPDDGAAAGAIPGGGNVSDGPHCVGAAAGAVPHVCGGGCAMSVPAGGVIGVPVSARESVGNW